MFSTVILFILVVFVLSYVASKLLDTSFAMGVLFTIFCFVTHIAIRTFL
ncbi:hypothetical protein BIZ90_gp090 [Escherichia phage vB_EcoM_Alf5]|uniref:Uncharacterized protein n=2 Tax=Felixounavirus TaxID=1198140 RepID=A0A0A0RKM0_9CAUD|nr:hypothetical protein ACQ43_gp090 [Escherichia phage vB_EcoM-VpaE1]YP_009288271.1 hypothetical protein BIZ90_gp090 [Escherichia phage vB_EcoM_Alf5]AIW02348.1 hypothetical protein VpaE1_088 [Escherichia phage vB_EcoM-VpaE1]ANT42149.1 hypothetical protein Alf5_087 [Escherichia phage vB_EcoM_Alf5]